jgi:LacI family transcriptional regulator
VAECLLERRPGKGLYVRDTASPATSTVKVIVGNLAWEPSVRVARGVQEVAKKYGIEVQISDAHGSQEENLQALLSLPENGADGAVLMALHTSDFNEAVVQIKATGFPLVVVDDRLREIEVVSVAADNYQGGTLAGEHLAAAGHRRVAFVGDCAASTVHDRLDGFRDALAEAGIALPRRYVVDITPKDRFADWDEIVGQAVTALLQLESRPTAVFCSCDAVARACYRVCAALRLKVPEDVSLVGFDDDPLAEWLTPALTTVRQPFREMGRTAMELLLTQLTKRAARPENVVLPVEWVERGSTGVTHSS